MTGRRRHDRYVLANPLEGSLHVREEVTIERWDEDEIVALSTVPSRLTDRLTLELPGKAPRHVAVTVAESRPIVASDGSLLHRLRLLVHAGAGNDGNSNGGQPK